jgi:hypothetical protein
MRSLSNYLRWVLIHTKLDWWLRTAIEARVRLAGPAARRPRARDRVDPTEMYIRGFELGEADCREQIGRALKDAYREATMRHHPDRGGSHDAMVAVNYLYERFEEILGRPA